MKLETSDMYSIFNMPESKEPNCETCKNKKLIGKLCGCDGIAHKSCYESEEEK